jgi:hypothetical protein
LISAQGNHILVPQAKTFAEVRTRFRTLEDRWKKEFGYGFDAETDGRLRRLLDFRTADAVRDRLAAARDAARRGPPERATRGPKGPDGETGAKLGGDAGGGVAVQLRTANENLSDGAARFLRGEVPDSPVRVNL